MAKKFDAKAKAKRQKIVAAVLGVLLLGVLAYELPSVMKMMNKKPPASAPAPAAVAPAVPAVAGTPMSASAPSSGVLVDSDPAAQAAGGQLVSFDRFPTKDPFVQQAGAALATERAAKAKAKATPAATRPSAAPKQAAAAPSSARISVNSATESVAVSQTFPQADPVFALVSLTKTTAKIRVAGGSLATGNPTVTLRKGKKVTLMNTADGTRYELVLVSVS